MKKNGAATPMNTVKLRMETVREAAATLGDGPILVQYVGTSRVFLVATSHGFYRSRTTPIKHTENYRKVTEQLGYLPKIIHTVPLDNKWHCEFIEWFEGFTFHQMRAYGIPTQAYYQFGRFLSDTDFLGMGIGDCNLGNILHCPDRQITFMCEPDMYNRTPKHTPECIKKLLRGADEDQEKAFNAGYRDSD
jgi:hypothetical protein